jgi:MscS family membrane protein
MDSFYKYYVDVKFAVLQQMPNILIFFSIVLGSWLVQRYVIKTILNRMATHYANKQMDFKKEICDNISKPARNLVFAIGFLFACGYALNVSVFTVEPLFKIFKTLLIFFFFQAIYYVASYFGEHPDALKTKFNLKTQNVLFPFFARIIKVFVVFIGFAMIAYEWGYDINGFVAGLGIGGLALALGAKDALSHIFAGISMAIDKPFAIGDLISTDNNLEGVVEDMNFRSTRIRTLDKALVSVPNAVIANQYIYNWTRRQNRRVRFLLGVTHSTTEVQLKKITERIKEVIVQHKDVEVDSVTVAFDNYTPNSLDLLILYVTNTNEFNEFMLIKEEINYEIMKILKEENVLVAFPSTSLYFKNDLSITHEKENKRETA